MNCQNASPFTEELGNEPPQPKVGWGRTALVYGAALIFYFYYATLKTSQARYDANDQFIGIERIHPAVLTTMGWGCLAIALTLIGLALASPWRCWLRWPVIGVLIAVIVCPISAVSHLLNNLGPWTTHGEVQSQYGKRYVFCDSSFLQGQMMAIAEVRSVGLFSTSYRVLVRNNGDSPRSWIPIIRPNQSSDEYGQLYLCKNMLVGVRYDNKAFLAYDLKNKKAYGHDDIESLSPFVCLEKGSVPSELDVLRTCGYISEHAQFCATSNDKRHTQAYLDGERSPGFPAIAAIKAGLASDSPQIVAAAQSLLARYDHEATRVKARLNGSSKIAKEPSQ